jgi:transketolase
MPHERDLDQVAINTIRTLAIDAIQKANSGHPGTPMGAAPTAYTLWQRILRYDPEHPDWLNRDRFVLSSGHASVLLYGLIHLSGIIVNGMTLTGVRAFGSGFLIFAASRENPDLSSFQGRVSDSGEGRWRRFKLRSTEVSQLRS